MSDPSQSADHAGQSARELWEHLETRHSFKTLPKPKFSNRERLESLHNFDHFTYGDLAHNRSSGTV